MVFRVLSGLFCGLALVSAYLQLNDPDPERWTAMYLACAWVALLGALGKTAPKQALVAAIVALVWSAAILPELVGAWKPSDLTATMTSEHPEIEYGREFFGLLIVGGYCLGAWFWMRSRAVRRPAV